MDVATECYSTTKAFPTSEMYGMTSQIRRASVSIAANIAEGYGRDNTGSYLQFLRIARGSLKELETHLILSERVGLMPRANAQALLSKADEIGRMLNALINKLKSAS
jgi:four helix bundle protein